MMRDTDAFFNVHSNYDQLTDRVQTCHAVARTLCPLEPIASVHHSLWFSHLVFKVQGRRFVLPRAAVVQTS